MSWDDSEGSLFAKIRLRRNERARKTVADQMSTSWVDNEGFLASSRNKSVQEKKESEKKSNRNEFNATLVSTTGSDNGIGLLGFRKRTLSLARPNTYRGKYQTSTEVAAVVPTIYSASPIGSQQITNTSRNHASPASTANSGLKTNIWKAEEVDIVDLVDGNGSGASTQTLEEDLSSDGESTANSLSPKQRHAQASVNTTSIAKSANKRKADEAHLPSSDSRSSVELHRLKDGAIIKVAPFAPMTAVLTATDRTSTESTLNTNAATVTDTAKRTFAAPIGNANLPETHATSSQAYITPTTPLPTPLCTNDTEQKRTTAIAHLERILANKEVRDQLTMQQQNSLKERLVELLLQ